MKIALIGYGKMGKEIERIALSRGHEIVSIIDLNNRADMMGEAFRSAQVAIEFTNPASARDNCLQAFRAGVKVVSGSTGWLDSCRDEMERLCREEGKTLLWSSNFSLGVAIFSAVNRYLARIMNTYTDYRPTLTETHHIHKLDAPSGTAITLAEDIVKRIDRLDSWTPGTHQAPDGNITGSTACADNQLPVSSIRRGEVPGIHTICYDGPADSIVLTHDAKNRSGFALGAVLAAEYVAGHQGFLGIEDLFPFLKD